MRTKVLFAAVLIILTAALAAAQSPAAVEKMLLQQLDTTSKYGSYGDSYDEAKLSAGNKKIIEILRAKGTRSDILQYDFPALKDRIFITTSEDGKLRIYSWDMQTGGTLHDYASVIQYQGRSGKVNAWVDVDEPGGGGFYSQIFQVPTSAGTIYLANSTFTASTSLAGQSIRALRINNDKLELKPKVIRTSTGLRNEVGFAYDFFSVSDRPERPIKLFFFDEKKKEFRFPVVIEDDKTPQGRVTDKFITYRFNGKYFVKIS